MKKLLSVLFLTVGFAFAMQAQDITGVWKTIDDETGEAKSYVTIYEKDGKYFGKVTKILNEEKKDKTCDKCKDDRKDQPILNMVIINNMEQVRDDAYKGGKILDPNKGKEYKCEIYVKDGGNTLRLKGCVGPICRGQDWYKVQ